MNTHFDFQGGSPQLFRDSPRHTHTHSYTHPGLGSVETMAAPVLSTAPSLCLCSASSHCCPASVSVTGFSIMRGRGVCRGLGQLQWSVQSYAACDREEFPFIRCPLPSAFSLFLSATVHSQLQTLSSPSVAYLCVWRSSCQWQISSVVLSCLYEKVTGCLSDI